MKSPSKGSKKLMPAGMKPMMPGGMPHTELTPPKKSPKKRK